LNMLSEEDRRIYASMGLDRQPLTDTQKLAALGALISAAVYLLLVGGAAVAWKTPVGLVFVLLSAATAFGSYVTQALNIEQPWAFLLTWVSLSLAAIAPFPVLGG